MMLTMRVVLRVLCGIVPRLVADNQVAYLVNNLSAVMFKTAKHCHPNDSILIKLVRFQRHLNVQPPSRVNIFILLYLYF